MDFEKNLMSLNIQLFADGEEDNNANDNTEDNKDVSSDKTDEKNNKSEEKKYSDKDVNDISLKNEKKALAKQLKDLGIDNIEEAKSILAKARAEKEASKTTDDKYNEVSQKYNKARLEAIDSKIENALLRKGVSESRVERAVRLIDKNNILTDDGEIDLSKLTTEVENTIKDFPELIPTDKEEQKGFKVGGDGKEDKKTDEMSEIRKIMGLK